MYLSLSPQFATKHTTTHVNKQPTPSCVCDRFQNCSEFLEKNLRANNCLNVIELASKYHLVDLAKQTMAFINKNFKHILFNNGAHDSVGGQLTDGFSVNFSEIAKNSNYNIINCNDYNDESYIKESVKKLLNTDGPVFLELRCDKGARSDLGRPPSSLENKKLFLEHLKNINC